MLCIARDMGSEFGRLRGVAEGSDQGLRVDVMVAPGTAAC